MVWEEVRHIRDAVLIEVGLGVELNSALEAFAAGDSAMAIARLSCLDRRLASVWSKCPSGAFRPLTGKQNQ
jgi:hypothetical protein